MGGVPNRILGDEHLRLGALLLGLVSDWDAWVSRRVDSFYFAGDDERVLHRRQSVDFTLPKSLTADGSSLFEGYGGFPAPITFVSKWRLPEFSLRDGADNTVSLLQRDDSVLAGVLGLIHLANAAATQQPLQLIMAKSSSRSRNSIVHRPRSFSRIQRTTKSH